MSRRVNLTLAGAAALLVSFVALNLASGDASGPISPARSPRAPVATPEIEPADSPNERTYAVPVAELPGLPPDAAPGTRLDLWVAWEPPITKGPTIRRLLRGVTLQRVVRALTPGSSPTAVLVVAERHIPDLLYGDRYGAFSVTVLPDG